jgi:hypothetical protein
MSETEPVFETWAPVLGFEDAYEVSDIGRVRSRDRVDTAGRKLRGCLLRACIDSTGYRSVGLYRGGIGATKRVHVLVAEAFHGGFIPGLHSCHNDGDKLNNLSTNIRWDTVSENGKDRVRHGTHEQSNKTHCPRGHELIPENIRESDRIKGYRGCLSCSRGRSEVQRGVSANLQSASDKHYARIRG